MSILFNNNSYDEYVKFILELIVDNTSIPGIRCIMSLIGFNSLLISCKFFIPKRKRIYKNNLTKLNYNTLSTMHAIKLAFVDVGFIPDTVVAIDGVYGYQLGNRNVSYINNNLISKFDGRTSFAGVDITVFMVYKKTIGGFTTGLDGWKMIDFKDLYSTTLDLHHFAVGDIPCDGLELISNYLFPCANHASAFTAVILSMIFCEYIYNDPDFDLLYLFIEHFLFSLTRSPPNYGFENRNGNDDNEKVFISSYYIDQMLVGKRMLPRFKIAKERLKFPCFKQEYMMARFDRDNLISRSGYVDRRACYNDMRNLACTFFCDDVTVTTKKLKIFRDDYAIVEDDDFPNTPFETEFLVRYCNAACIRVGKMEEIIGEWFSTNIHFGRYLRFINCINMFEVASKIIDNG
jgi:hypothetical protein